MTERPCPVCRNPVDWSAAPDRPFCSERCRIRDLAAWADGSYAIPAGDVQPPEENSEDNI